MSSFLEQQITATKTIMECKQVIKLQNMAIELLLEKIEKLEGKLKNITCSSRPKQND